MGVVWLAASGFGPWLRPLHRHATSSFAAFDASIWSSDEYRVCPGSPP
jgi:hypothetical protein